MHACLTYMRVSYVELSLIQGRYSVTLVYTPGKSGSAQRAPQDTTPHSSHVLVAGFMQFRGPPESPWHESLGGRGLVVSFGWTIS